MFREIIQTNFQRSCYGRIVQRSNKFRSLLLYPSDQMEALRIQLDIALKEISLKSAISTSLLHRNSRRTSGNYKSSKKNFTCKYPVICKREIFMEHQNTSMNIGSISKSDPVYCKIARKSSEVFRHPLSMAIRDVCLYKTVNLEMNLTRGYK